MRKLTLILLAVLTGFFPARGQQSWQHYFELLVQTMDDEQAEDLSLVYDALSEVASSPININAITADDLHDMMCFSDAQIDAVTTFIRRFGPVRSKGELMMIPYLDDVRRGLLSSLTYIGEAEEPSMTFLDTLRREDGLRNLKQTFGYSDHRTDVLATAHVPLYQRKGDVDGYAGSKVKHWLRATHKVNRHLRVGVVASQDAGEPFFSAPNQHGYDFYSGYVRLQKMGILKNAVVGRYRIRNALGLITNSNMTFGKTFSSTPAYGSSTTILPHSSRSEANYMQGGAVTLALTKRLEATLFASYRTIDATLTADSLGIRTILKTGYHRTQSEIARRHNAFQSTFGGNVRYSTQRFNVGATYVSNHFSLPLMPYTDGSSLSQLYRRFMPTGSDFWNASIDYAYKMGKRLHFSGETATDGQHLPATINTLSVRLANTLTLSAIQRFYPFRFVAVMGNSFSEGGTNQDESGFYLGATWTPTTRLAFTAYSDIAYFAWPKYQALGSTHAFDNLVQANYTLSSHSSLSLRYRIKLREKNADTSSDDYKPGNLVYKNEQRLRLSLLLQRSKWTYKSQLDMAYCKQTDQSIGGMMSQTVAYSDKKMKIAAGLGYFHTKDYNSRVYAYEQSTPYNLSFPSFYGHGCRAYAVAQATPLRHLSVIGKIGFTRYFDRNEIGSGQQLIKSNHQSDVDIMLRWTL